MNPGPYRNMAAELTALDVKVNALLPPRYQHCYESVSPASMGSAGLLYDSDGNVAWDRIWTSFCDLALAGGPPHRGRLLEPASEAEVTDEPERYAVVVGEIVRAIAMTTGLAAIDGYAPGWVGVPCRSVEAAAWLQFAVTAENVTARRRREVLQLPAGPAFRVEKEIKNVVVALAKACHYWKDHLTDAQQGLAGDDVWEAASPAEAADSPAEYEASLDELVNVLSESGLAISSRRYIGWVGVEMTDEEDAVWLLRAVLADRVLARREQNILYLPVPATPGAGSTSRAARVFLQAWELRLASLPYRPARRPS